MNFGVTEYVELVHAGAVPLYAVQAAVVQFSFCHVKLRKIDR